DGIRDRNVTGVQTCALPICAVARDSGFLARCLISKPASTQGKRFINGAVTPGGSLTAFHERLMELARASIEKSSEDERYCLHFRSEERGVGKGGRFRWSESK